jgi:hypothetical protein
VIALLPTHGAGSAIDGSVRNRKVIGSQGRNVQAIRVILGAAGMKLKKRVEIIEQR